MHEEALLRDLAERVGAVARTHGLLRVRRIRLWVGALSHLEDGALRARWADLATGGPAEGSTVEITRSADLTDPRAQSVVLLDVVGEDDVAAPPG